MRYTRARSARQPAGGWLQERPTHHTMSRAAMNGQVLRLPTGEFVSPRTSRVCVLGLNRAWRTSEGSFCACACVWIGLDHQLACGGIGPAQTPCAVMAQWLPEARRAPALVCCEPEAPGGVLRRVALPLTPALCGRLGHRVRPQRARREGESLSGARVAGAAPLPSGVAGSHPNPEDAPPPPPPRRAVRGSRDRAGGVAPLGAQRRERRDAAQGSRAHLPASDFSAAAALIFFFAVDSLGRL